MYNQEYIVDEIIKKDLIKEHPELKKLIRTTSPHEVRGGIMSVLDKNRRVHRDIKFYENLTKKFEYESYIDEIVVNVRKYIEVADCEKEEFGEVMTPIQLVEEMLDTLPKEVWTNKNLKWLDPCCGVGTFPSVIVQRLMKGLKTQIPNPKKRYKHIIEEMIYVCEIQAKNLFAFHYVFDKPDIYELNTFYGSFLTDEFNEHMKNEWNIEKFDIIVGNPPYQDSNNTQGKNSSLWTKFILKSNLLLVESGYLNFITPSSWIAPSETQKNELKNVFNGNDLIHLDTKCKKYFSVGSTFSYYTIKKTKTNVLTNVNNEFKTKLNLPFLPNILTKETINITNKIFLFHQECLNISSGKRVDTFVENGRYQVWYGNNLKRTNILGGNAHMLKVILNKPGYLNPRFDDGKYNTSANNYWVQVSNKKEAENIINFLNHKITKILLEKLFKYSGYNSLGILKRLPKIITTKKWENISDFKTIFNLSQEEINLIESQTK